MSVPDSQASTQIDYISVCLTVIRLKMIVITCFSLASRVPATGIMAVCVCQKSATALLRFAICKPGGQSAHQPAVCASLQRLQIFAKVQRETSGALLAGKSRKMEESGWQTDINNQKTFCCRKRWVLVEPFYRERQRATWSNRERQRTAESYRERQRTTKMEKWKSSLLAVICFRSKRSSLYEHYGHYDEHYELAKDS